jgi:hypothetical protein
MYLLMIHSWQVDEMELHCCLARFVICNTGSMRCSLAANQNGGIRGNMIHSDEQWEQLPGDKRSARCGVMCGKEEYQKRC